MLRISSVGNLKNAPFFQREVWFGPEEEILLLTTFRQKTSTSDIMAWGFAPGTGRGFAKAGIWIERNHQSEGTEEHENGETKEEGIFKTEMENAPDVTDHFGLGNPAGCN